MNIISLYGVKTSINDKQTLITHSKVFRRAPGEFPGRIYCPVGICNEIFPEATLLAPTPDLSLETLGLEYEQIQN